MFFDAKKSTERGCYFFKFSTFALILLSKLALAAECGILQLQTHRSLGTSISHNQCPTATDLALESIIELQAGTRVWLASVEKSETAENFQIVCLNKSSSVQQLKIASVNLPWLTPLNQKNCSTWLDNRLTCKQTDNQHESLLCAISQKTAPATIRTVQSKTSVTVRGFNRHLKSQSLNEQRNWSDFVTPSIDLCRKLLKAHHPITLNWTIETSGTVSHTSITDESGMDTQFTACTLEALENIHFPAVAHAIRLTASF